MRKIFYITSITITLTLFPTLAFALTLEPAERLAYSIHRVMTTISTLLFFLSSLVVIYGVHISRKRQTTTKGFTGMVLSAFLFILSRLFLRLFAPHAFVNSTLTLTEILWTISGIILVGMIVCVSVWFIFKSWVSSPKKKRIFFLQETANVKQVSLESSPPFLAYLSKKTFQIEEGMTYLSSSSFSWHATFEVKDWQHVITLYQQDLAVCTFLYHKQEEVMDVVVPKGLTLTDVPDNLASVGLSVHLHLYEQYLSQHFSINKGHEAYASSISSSKVQEAVSSLLALHYKVLSYHKQFSSETLIFLNELFPEDVKQLLHPYLRLPSSQQQQMESSLLDKLSLLHKRLASYEEDINTQLEKDVEYAFRLIDEKYQTPKDNEV